MANKKDSLVRVWDKLPEAEKLHYEAEGWVKTIQDQLGMPYSKEHYIATCKNLLQKTAETIIVIGKMLLVIKHYEGKGFHKILEEEFGIHERTAQRFMKAALASIKYKNIKFDQFSKLSHVYALLEAPEEELEKLDKMGVLANKTMDELDAMSVKELKETIRKLKNEKDKIVAEETKNLQMEKEVLLKEVERLKQYDPEKNPPDYLVKRMERIDELYTALESEIRQIVFSPVILDYPEYIAQCEAIMAKIFSFMQQFKDAFYEYINLGYEEPIEPEKWMKRFSKSVKQKEGIEDEPQS